MNEQSWSKVKNQYHIKLTDTKVSADLKENGMVWRQVTIFVFNIGQQSNLELERHEFFDSKGNTRGYSHDLMLNISHTELADFLIPLSPLADGLIYLIVDILKSYRSEIPDSEVRMRIEIANDGNTALNAQQMDQYVVLFIHALGVFREKINQEFEGEILLFHADAKPHQRFDLAVNYFHLSLIHINPQIVENDSVSDEMLEVLSVGDSLGNIAFLQSYSPGEQSTYYPGNPDIREISGVSSWFNIVSAETSEES